MTRPRPSSIRPVALSFAMLLVLLAGSNARAQADLRPRFAVGQRAVYEIQLRVNETTNGAGVPIVSERRQMLRLRTNILGVDERGAASATVVAERVRLHRDGEKAVRTERSEDDAMDRTKPVNQVERVADAMVGRILRLDLAPDGRVDAVYGLDRVRDLINPDGISRDQRLLLGAYDETAASAVLGAIWHLDGLDADGNGIDRAVGDVWTNTWSARVGRGVRLNGTDEYTLDAITDGVAEVVGVPSLETDRIALVDEPGGQGAGIVPDVSASISEGEIRARWQVDEHHLLGSTRREVRRVVVSVPGAEPVTRVSEITIEVRRVPDQGSGDR